MKTSIKSIALLLAAAFPCVAYAEFLGAPFAPVVAAEILTGAFLLLLFGLMLVADYSRRPRIRLVLRARCASADSARRESHRLAA